MLCRLTSDPGNTFPLTNRVGTAGKPTNLIGSFLALGSTSMFFPRHRTSLLTKNLSVARQSAQPGFA